MPNVSVVVPIYNAEKCIRKAIDSVLRQTYPDLELILVLDGCTDSTSEICESYNDSRIKILKQINQGPSSARNKGIAAANGTIVAFLDADDYWESEKLEKHVSHLEKFPNVGISFSCSQFIGHNGEKFFCYQVPTKLEIDLETQVRVNPMGNGSSPVLRKKTLEDVRLAPGVYFHEDLRRCEDYELWARILANTTWKMACLPEPLTNYRLGSSSGSWDPKVHLEALEKASQLISSYASHAMSYHGKPHQALARFYIARTLLFHGKPFQSWLQCIKAIKENWRVLNFHRLMVFIGATAGMIIPNDLLVWFEKLAFKYLGRSQTKQMALLKREMLNQIA